MLQFMPVFDDNTIVVRASGKLSHKDYLEFLPQLEEQIKEYGKVSLLFEFDNFKGWDLGAAKDDFKFGMKHLADFERIAMVGDKVWEHWMAVMVKPFLSSGTVQYFNRENLQDAWDWLREKQDFEKAVEQIQPYKDIVVAVDFSLHSKHACKRALELANYYQSSLTLLNISPEVFPYPSYGAMGMYAAAPVPENLEEQNKHFFEIAESQMIDFVEELNTDFVLNTKVISGDSNTSIVSYLEAQKSDLVIFGAKKKKGLNKLLGSTPNYVQNHSRCEILIVPVQDPVF